MIYYVSDIPCSDELYHYGIMGQKWGVRRYQNPDGTLTSLGKAHYALETAGRSVGNGLKSAGNAVGRAAKSYGRYRVDIYKRKHPWLMSDDELNAYVDRAQKIEKASRDRASARSRTFHGKVSDIIENAADKAVSNLAGQAATAIGKQYAAKMQRKIDKKRFASSMMEQKAFKKDYKKRKKSGTPYTNDELKERRDRIATLREIEEGRRAKNK